MLTEQQESNLVSGGDCPDHWHSQDRVLDRSSLLTLQSLARAYETNDSITVTDTMDYVIVDTSAANVTITLPRSHNGREIEVMKNATPNFLKIITTYPDKILGDSEVRVYNYGTALRFKAVTTGWVIV